MLNNYTLRILLCILFAIEVPFKAISQQNTTTAGTTIVHQDVKISYSIGEVFNAYSILDSGTIKAGVLQPNLPVQCPLPVIQQLLSSTTDCIFEGQDIELFFAQSQIGAEYQVYLNGVAIPDVKMGNGGLLKLGRFRDQGTYTVEGRIQGKTCSTPMEGSVALRKMPVASLEQVNPVCTGDAIQFKFSASLPALISYQVDTREVQTLRIFNKSERVIFTGLTASAAISILSVRSFDNGCLNEVPQKLSVQIVDRPSIQANDLEVCSDTKFFLPLASSSKGVQVEWTATYAGLIGGKSKGDLSASSLLSEGLTNLSDTAIRAQYTLTPYLTNPVGCKGAALVVSVTVHPLPRLEPIGTVRVCSGAPLFLPVRSTTGTAEVYWSRSTTSGIANDPEVGTGDIQEILINTAAVPVTVNYTITLKETGCFISSPQTVSVVVLPAPILKINPPAVVCSGFQDLTLPTLTDGSSPGLQFSYWKDRNLSTAVSDPKSVPPGVYYIQGKSVNGCTVVEVLNIESILEWRINPIAPICPGSTVDLQAPEITAGSELGLQYSYWVDEQAQIPLFNPSAVSAGTYYVRAAKSVGRQRCVDIKPVEVVAWNATLENMPSNSSVCTGTTFHFEPKLNLKQAKFYWYRSFTSALGLQAKSDTGTITQQVVLRPGTTQATLAYAYRIAVPGCEAQTPLEFFEVQVHANPNFEVISPVELCEPFMDLSNPTLIVTASPNVTFGYFMDAQATQPVPYPKTVSQGRYYIQAKTHTGCSTTRTVEVKHKLNIQTPAPYGICPPQRFNLQVTTLKTWNESTYTLGYWRDGQKQLTLPEPNEVDAGTYFISVREKSSVCEQIVPVTVQSASPQLLSELRPPAQCSGETFLYVPKGPSPLVSFNWEYKSNKKVTGTGTIQLQLNNTGSAVRIDTFFIQASSNVCMQTKSFLVQVPIIPKPTLTATTDSQICSDDILVVGVRNLPDIDIARFDWTADYRGLVGGAGFGLAVPFGNRAIQERLINPSDTTMRVLYHLTPYVAAHNRQCFGEPATLKVEVHPKRAAGCGLQLIGTIQTIEGQAVEGVEVGISDDQFTQTQTDVQGVFQFNGLKKGGDFTVLPQLDENPMNGVSTFDAILIKQHLLNVKQITNPYQLIAADINRNNQITILDLIQLRRMILGLEERFVGNTSWRFVPDNHQFIQPNQPWKFPELANYNDLNQDSYCDFIGIKVGDLNGSARANSRMLLEGRSRSIYLVHTEDIPLIQGTHFVLTLIGDPVATAEGIQFTLAYDPEALELMELKLPEDVKEQLGCFKGYITVSWEHSVIPNKPFLSLPFKVKREKPLSEVLQINGRITSDEAYVDGQVLQVGLNVQESRLRKGNVLCFDAFPNPFSDQVIIPFFTPEKCRVVLEVFDITGRKLLEIPRMVEEGYQQFELDVQSLNTGNLWYYQLEIGSQKFQGKLVRLGF